MQPVEMTDTEPDSERTANVEVNENADDPMFSVDEEGGLQVDDDIYIPPPPKHVHEQDATGPRLMITKITNENFKSYAGKQVVGPFHKCFSAIVGPNGSGKSNVIDSMLFVFGYRASKIRSKKVSVLIHNSSQYPNINSCTVSVHFQRIIDTADGSYDVVPNSEFVISRTALKDNSSFYELNRMKVQFKVIAKLLRSYGVDLDHNRFLILQGEVEQIAMMKPKGQTETDVGMLEYLEDIIGTVRYKEALNKLSERVELLTELKVEKLNRLHVTEAEKAALQGPMEEAVAYLKIENAITKLQHKLYHCKRSELSKQLVVQEQNMGTVNDHLSDVLKEIKVIKKKKEEQNSIIKEKCKKWDNLQSKKDEKSTKFDKIRKQDESLHAEYVETNKRRKANIATLKSEKNKLQELLTVPDKSSKDITECESLLKRYEANKTEEETALSTLMDGLREKTQPLLNERSQLEKQLISWKENVHEAKASLDILQSQLELYMSIETVEKEKLLKLKETLQNISDTLKQRKQQLVSFEKKIPATEASLSQSQKELEELKEQEANMNAKLKNMRILFEEKKSAMQATRSRNKVLDSLMREKAEGRISGIFGRLGDLGAIDGKYDIAVSTACGPLNNIVVDTVATAKACISFLRENDIGRASFIPLEKQERFLSKCKQKIDTPENVPRLFDLIKVEDNRVLPAFYYGVQDTLVANNLDQATRIAYGKKRFRVVTLKGELIELSGTMSGGGQTVLKGRMGQRVIGNESTAEDIEKLQSQLDTVYEGCNQFKVKQKPIESQIHALSTALKEMKTDKDKFNIEIQTLRDQEPLLEVQIQAQQRKAAEAVSDPKKIQKMKKEVDAKNKHLSEIEGKSNSIEKEVKRINVEIDKISGGSMKIQNKISELTKLINKTRGEICKLQVAIKTAERNATKTKQRIESLEKDVHTSEETLREINTKTAELEEEAKVILKEINELGEALQERDEYLSTVKEELNVLQSQESELKAIKIDLDEKVKENNHIIQELKQKIPNYSSKISELKLHAIPGEKVEELKELSESEVDRMNEKTLSANLNTAKNELPSEIPNMQVIANYQCIDKIYLERVKDLQEITSKQNKLRDNYENAKRCRLQEFLKGFLIITGKLKEMYQMITLGGDAELELVDTLDPFNEGIVFSVRPPKKSWKNISNLSGGEKTLSSLALVFALHHYKPTPLYFMDEIDAALDFKNVSIVANYIKERTKNAQFIVISLRSNMFELADYLVGIFKTYNCTKSVTVYLSKYYDNDKTEPQSQPTASNHINMYYSQKPKSPSKLSVNAQNTHFDPQIPGTCLGQTENHNSESIANISPGSPELRLCPTPQKPPVEKKRSTCNLTSEDRSTSKEPLRKKRKMKK